MPENDLKEQIRKLVELQKVDSEIYEIKTSLKEKPEIIQQLKQNFESKKTKLKSLEEKATALQLERKQQELELKTKEESISKANSQLSQLKTNKEYSAKLAEIESIKADKSIIEEKILISLDESDAILAQINEEKNVVASEEKKFVSRKDEIEKEIKQFEEKIKQLESQKNQNLSGINVQYLTSYEKILKNKQGLAIVPLVGTSCGGCYMNVTNQTINSMKMKQELIYCQICSRILYIEDDL